MKKLSLADKLAKKSFESESFQKSWAVHMQAFGPILEPAFAENPQVRIILINALNHISRREVKRGMELLKEIHQLFNIKGILFLAVAVLHTIYFCIPGAKTAITKLSDFFGGSANATGTDCYYGFVMILLLVFLAIYMLMNIIRSFINAKKASMLVVVSGYFTVLLAIVCFVVNFASKSEGLFAFGFVPIDLGFATLILADIFAIMSRAKKFED